MSSTGIDQLLAARHAVGGPGHVATTDPISQALVVHLAARFQLYCRELHRMGADAIISAAPAQLQPSLRHTLLTNRRLDRHNAHSVSIRADFARFGFELWQVVDVRDRRCVLHRQKLDQLIAWRSAVAHHDFRSIDGNQLTRDTRPDLATFRTWREAVYQLAGGMDRALYAELTRINGTNPW